jgi:hypothetical protein
MPASIYTAWSVVADEQPTAAKWNILGSNDGSFNTGVGFNDDIIKSRHIQIENNAALNGLSSAAAEKMLMKLGTDNAVRIGQVSAQAQATNTIEDNVLMQTGWGFMTTPGGTGSVSRTVTFPVAYTKLLGLVCTQLGQKVTTDPAVIPDLTTNFGVAMAGAVTPSLTGFIATITLPTGSYGINERWAYSWIALGVKA